MGRIIDKIADRRQQFRTQPPSHAHPSTDGAAAPASLPTGWYYSFEFFPPKTEAGLDNLLTRIDRMTRRLDPLFIDVTWGTAGSTAARSMAVASYAQKYSGVEVLLHLSTVGCTREQLARFLDQAKASGIQNILALRGDPPKEQRAWKLGDVSGGDCDRAIDLVRLIRQLHGDYFGIAVAGHPEGHPSSPNPDDEMIHLKEKVKAGADFILTQFFYDTELFLNFVKRCRATNITCPIIPGIMPIQSFRSFIQMTDYCQVSVPTDVYQRVYAVKDDDEAVKDIGCDLAAEMCQRILTEQSIDSGGLSHGDTLLSGVHFYTLNLERSVTRILVTLGAVDFVITPHDIDVRAGEDSASTALLDVDNLRTVTGRALPWRPSTMANRSKKEQVRPINWANRPKSYVMRTEDWDEFPNGRWGDATSPAFGELSDVSHFYSFSLGSDDDRRTMLGEVPKVVQDVYDVFARYVEGKIPHLPWCETPLQPESFVIQPKLALLNRAGFLTINSQPAANAVPSSDNVFGWGGPGGYVYQKAYCECFCSPENTQRLVDMVKNHKSMNLYAVNLAGQEIKQGSQPGVTALTWGVFPNREILQPTIFDPSTFLVWAEEAFSLWTTMWLNLYEYGTESYELIESMRDTYFLCAIIDNDFINGAQETTGGSSIWKFMLDMVNG